MTDLNNFTNNDDFFKLLNEMKNDPIPDYNNICLISNEKLEKDNIKLLCGHTFNYEHIFNEVKRQKTSSNHYEITKLSNIQIKCPYCRKVSNGILPWKPNFPKLNFVNWPPSLSYIKKKCIYIFKSGIKKGLTCDKFCCWTGKYCKNHQKIMDKRKLKEKEKIKKKNNGDDISKMNVKQLKSFCKSNHIKRYSKLRKAELIELIETKLPNKSSKQSFDKNKIITI